MFIYIYIYIHKYRSLGFIGVTLWRRRSPGQAGPKMVKSDRCFHFSYFLTKYGENSRNKLEMSLFEEKKRRKKRNQRRKKKHRRAELSGGVGGKKLKSQKINLFELIWCFFAILQYILIYFNIKSIKNHMKLRKFKRNCHTLLWFGIFFYK